MYVAPSRAHPTGLDRIIPLHHARMAETATAGLLTCALHYTPHAPREVQECQKLMASGLPEKMSVTVVLAATRRLQQRDCPGFSPDSLLIATHSNRPPGSLPRDEGRGCSHLWRHDVAANQLRVQRYYKKTNYQTTSCRFYLAVCVFLPKFAQKSQLHITNIYLWQQQTTRRLSSLWWEYPRLSHKTRNRF